MQIVSFVLSIMVFSAGYKVKDFIADLPPPGRLREIKDALAEIRGLLGMLEHKGHLSETDEAQKYWRQLVQLDRRAFELRKEVERWSKMGFAQFRDTDTLKALLSNCSQLRKDIASMRAHLQHLPPPPPHKPTSNPALTETVNTPSSSSSAVSVASTSSAFRRPNVPESPHATSVATVNARAEQSQDGLATTKERGSEAGAAVREGHITDMETDLTGDQVTIVDTTASTLS